MVALMNIIPLKIYQLRENLTITNPVPSYTLLFIILFILILPFKIDAISPLVLEESQGRYPLALKIEVLEDKQKQWSFEDVSSPLFSDQFVLNTMETLSFGFTQSAIWIRFHLINPSPKEKTWLLEVAYPPVDLIEIYRPSPKGSYLRKQVGENIPFSQWEYDYPNPLFKITLQPNGEQTVYMRYYEEGSVPFPLILWAPQTFWENASKRQSVLGMYYGLIVVMIFYNLFIFVSVRDMGYFYYVLYVIGIGFSLTFFNGYAHSILWQESSAWWLNRNIFLWISFSVFWALQFIKVFLHTKINTPKIHHWMNFLMVSIVVGTLILYGIQSYEISSQILSGVFLLSNFTGLITGIICWKQGFQPARFFFY